MAKPLGPKKATEMQILFLQALMEGLLECEPAIYENLTAQEMSAIISPLVALTTKALREGTYYTRLRPTYWDEASVEDTY